MVRNSRAAPTARANAMEVDPIAPAEILEAAQESPLTPQSHEIATNGHPSTIQPPVTTESPPHDVLIGNSGVSDGLQALRLSADAPAAPAAARVEEKILLTTAPLQWVGSRYKPGDSLVGHLETFKDFLRGIPENLITFQAPRLFLESLTPGAQEIARMAGKDASWTDMRDELIKNYATSDNTKLSWAAEINELRQGDMSHEDFVARILRAYREFRDNHELNDAELETAESNCITAFLTRSSRKLMNQTSKLKDQWKRRKFQATLFDYVRELNQWSARERNLNHWDTQGKDANTAEPVFQIAESGTGNYRQTHPGRQFADPTHWERQTSSKGVDNKRYRERYRDHGPYNRQSRHLPSPQESPTGNRRGPPSSPGRQQQKSAMICRHDPRCNRVDCRFEHPSGHAFQHRGERSAPYEKVPKCGNCGTPGHVVQQCSQ